MHRKYKFIKRFLTFIWKTTIFDNVRQRNEQKKEKNERLSAYFSFPERLSRWLLLHQKQYTVHSALSASRVCCVCLSIFSFSYYNSFELLFPVLLSPKLGTYPMKLKHSILNLNSQTSKYLPSHLV